MKKRMWFTRNDRTRFKKAVVVTLVASLLLQTTGAAQVIVNRFPANREGFVDDPDCDYLAPSLAVDGQGNVGLGCTRTSAQEFPSVYVMMHAAKDAPGTMRAPVLAVKGTTYFRSPPNPILKTLGWGNYSSTCIDPLDSTLIWTCQEYANSPVESEWCTAWTAFRLTENKKTP